MITLKFDPEIGIWCEDPESLDRLKKNSFGEEKDGKWVVDPEEALYIIIFQNGIVNTDTGEFGFNQIASHFIKQDPRLIVKYNAYRDWRDRGLILKRFSSKTKHGDKKTHKKYPARQLKPEKKDVKIYWYKGSLFSVLDSEEAGKELFEKYWIGQLGVYKQMRGNLSRLDFFETIFLAKHFGFTIIDAESGKKITPSNVLKQVKEEREYTEQLYEVYEDWRLQSYVVKTGFKFGSHFRIYFPGASPVREDKWIHSKHVLHVFPKDQKMLISEWARAVRVAHSVKKTFLLGIPEMDERDYVDYPADYLAYKRKRDGSNWVRETPEDKPRYLMATVSEDEHIGGVELASLLKKASDLGLELMLSIIDRETAITYYVLKRVALPGSPYEYYEIEWEKP
ncbi:MAG: tRNA-intron lyase [Candidatus Aenigmarchaeota archaeon]|nr:tRNA-intron lyase [Candidatus Aenigmarchaeota archaeon]